VRRLVGAFDGDRIGQSQSGDKSPHSKILVWQIAG